MKIKHIKYKVHVLIAIYNNAAHPILCGGWYFIHMWRCGEHLHDRII